jgi:hypothetical protein
MHGSVTCRQCSERARRGILQCCIFHIVLRALALRSGLDDSAFLHLAADLMQYHQRPISVGQGTEYFGFDKYCKVQGIVRELSATYVPEQNGRVERLNRTLLERTRALIYA